MAMRLLTAILVLTSAATASAQWDTVLGDALDMPETGPHWVSVRPRDRLPAERRHRQSRRHPGHL